MPVHVPHATGDSPRKSHQTATQPPSFARQETQRSKQQDQPLAKQASIKPPLSVKDKTPRKQSTPIQESDEETPEEDEESPVHIDKEKN